MNGRMSALAVVVAGLWLLAAGVWLSLPDRDATECADAIVASVASLARTDPDVKRIAKPAECDGFSTAELRAIVATLDSAVMAPARQERDKPEVKPTAPAPTVTRSPWPSVRSTRTLAPKVSVAPSPSRPSPTPTPSRPSPSATPTRPSPTPTPDASPISRIAS